MPPRLRRALLLRVPRAERESYFSQLPILERQSRESHMMLHMDPPQRRVYMQGLIGPAAALAEMDPEDKALALQAMTAAERSNYSTYVHIW